MAGKKLKQCDAGQFWTSVVTLLEIAEALDQSEEKKVKVAPNAVCLAYALRRLVQQYEEKQAKLEKFNFDTNYVQMNFANKLIPIIEDRKKTKISYCTGLN